MTVLVTCSVYSKKMATFWESEAAVDVRMEHNVPGANILCHNSCDGKIFYQLLKTLYCGEEFIVTYLAAVSS